VSEQFLNGTSAQKGYLVPFIVYTIDLNIRLMTLKRGFRHCVVMQRDALRTARMFSVRRNN